MLKYRKLTVKVVLAQRQLASPLHYFNLSLIQRQFRHPMEYMDIVYQCCFSCLRGFEDLHCKIEFNAFLGFKTRQNGSENKSKSSESNFWTDGACQRRWLRLEIQLSTLKNNILLYTQYMHIAQAYISSIFGPISMDFWLHA